MCFCSTLGKEAHSDYLCNLAILDLEPLDDRREKLCKKFAAKTFKHPVHSKMFEIINLPNIRNKRSVEVPLAKTSRYKNSAIPSLANIINAL